MTASGDPLGFNQSLLFSVCIMTKIMFQGRNKELTNAMSDSLGFKLSPPTSGPTSGNSLSAFSSTSVDDLEDLPEVRTFVMVFARIAYFCMCVHASVRACVRARARAVWIFVLCVHACICFPVVFQSVSVFAYFSLMSY